MPRALAVSLRWALHLITLGLTALVIVTAARAEDRLEPAIITLAVLFAVTYLVGAAAEAVRGALVRRTGAPVGTDGREGPGGHVDADVASTEHARTELAEPELADLPDLAEPELRAPAARPAIANLAIAAWLATLCLLFLALSAMTPIAMYLALPIYFLVLHLLPLGIATTLVLALTGILIVILWLSDRLVFGAVMGPVLVAGVAIGLAVAFAALAREAEARRRVIGELVATRAALAESERRAGTLDERERLARELHDTVAQGLSSIQLLLHAAEGRVTEAAALKAPVTAAADAAPEPPGLHELRAAREAAADALAETRAFIRELAPPSLTGQSLEHALTALADRTRQANPRLTVEARAIGTPVPLPLALEAVLLRAAQASVANVVRHARASSLELVLSYDDEAREVTLDIIDDGAGFDPEAALAAGSAAGSFGLVALRQRVTRAGGRFGAVSAPGEGAIISVSVPAPATDVAPAAPAAPATTSTRPTPPREEPRA